MKALSDEVLGTFVPIILYWVYAGIYGALSSMERYRLHPIAEEKDKNLVSRKEVIFGVLLQQAIQAAVAAVLYAVQGQQPAESQTHSHTSPATLAMQFLVAMVVMDTWQYFMHRYLHHNQFLYKHVHSQHHQLVAPYAFGALYNHPLEGLLIDTGGGALSFLISGMSPRASIFFFSFATLKAVDDHCGMWVPGNPLHLIFSNNSAYHDVHHQLGGNKFNFSQPFFIMWDRVFGTYIPYEVEERGGSGGGLQARMLKKTI